MNLSDQAEEILEALWIRIKEKKQNCGISVLKDNEGLKELVLSGFVKIKNDNILLTGIGEKEAKNCVRRHRLAERLMVDVLDIKKSLMHETSCKFEHLLHKGLDESICTLLGHPKVCPHGKPIPEGKCCKDARKISGKAIMKLAELDVNSKAKVSYLQTENRNLLQKIIAMGALPGTEIKLIRNFLHLSFR